MLRELKQTLCAPGPKDPTETETELYLSVFSEGIGQQWPTTGTGALGSTDLCMELALLKQIPLTPP